jgi:hypothetical protein
VSRRQRLHEGFGLTPSSRDTIELAGSVVEMPDDDVSLEVAIDQDADLRHWPPGGTPAGRLEGAGPQQVAHRVEKPPLCQQPGGAASHNDPMPWTTEPLVDSGAGRGSTHSPSRLSHVRLGHVTVTMTTSLSASTSAVQYRRPGAEFRSCRVPRSVLGVRASSSGRSGRLCRRWRWGRPTAGPSRRRQ